MSEVIAFNIKYDGHGLSSYLFRSDYTPSSNEEIEKAKSILISELNIPVESEYGDPISSYYFTSVVNFIGNTEIYKFIPLVDRVSDFCRHDIEIEACPAGCLDARSFIENPPEED